MPPKRGFPYYLNHPSKGSRPGKQAKKEKSVNKPNTRANKPIEAPSPRDVAEAGPSNEEIVPDSQPSSEAASVPIPNMDALGADMDTLDSGIAGDVGASSAAAPVSGDPMGHGGLGARGTTEYLAGYHNGDHSWTKTFTKKYKLRMFTHPIQYRTRGNAAGFFPNEGIKFVQYPYHDLPVEKLGFYLSPLEIRQLISEGSRVEMESCSVEIHTRTNILPFTVGSTLSDVGNNNVGIEVFTMGDLTHKRFGVEMNNHAQIIRNIFWGNIPGPLNPSINPVSTINPNPPAWLVYRNFDNRFGHYAGMNPTANGITTNNVTGLYELTWFNYEAFKERAWNGSMLEGKCKEWHYVPKCKSLFGKNMIDAVFYNYGRNAGAENEEANTFQFINSDNVPLLNHQGNTAAGATNLLRNAPVNYPTQIQNDNFVASTENNGLRPLPATPWVYAESLTDDFLSNLEIDTNQMWQDGAHTKQVKMKVPNCSIGMEPLLNGETEVNTTVNNYFLFQVLVKCKVKVHQNPGYIYPHLGSARNAPPAFLDPMLEMGRVSGVANRAISIVNLQNLAGQFSSAGPPAETVTYNTNIVPTILNHTQTAPARFSERIRKRKTTLVEDTDSDKENIPPILKTKKKIDDIKKNLKF